MVLWNGDKTRSGRLRLRMSSRFATVRACDQYYIDAIFLKQNKQFTCCCLQSVENSGFDIVIWFTGFSPYAGY